MMVERRPSARQVARALELSGAPDRFIRRILDLPGYRITGAAEGRLAHIGFKKETTYGTPAAPAQYYFMFHKETVSSKLGEVIPPQITGFWDEGPSYLGKLTHDGVVTFNPYPDFFGSLLLSYGPDTLTTEATPVAGTYQHVFNKRDSAFGTNSVAQPFTFEIHRDFATAWQIDGMVIERLALMLGAGTSAASGPEQALTCDATMFGHHYTAISATTPSYESFNNTFMWNQCSISIGGSPYVTVQDVKLELDNGIGPKFYIDGTRETHSAVASGPRILHVSGTMLGDLNVFTDYIARTRRDWNIVFDSNNIPATSTPYSLTFDMPQVQYITYPIEVPDFKEIMTAFTCKAKFDPNVAGTPTVITLINDVSTQY